MDDGAAFPVHDYLSSLVEEDDALVAARSATASTGRTAMSPLVGRLLHLLAEASQATRVLECTTTLGYSTIWLARAVGPGGRVVSLTPDAAAASRAREHLEAAGVSGWVDVWVGSPRVTAERMVQVAVPSFDLVFMDADPAELAAQIGHATTLTSTGALLVIDVADREDPAPTRRPDVGAVLRAVEGEGPWEATAVGSVGVRGHAGLVVARRVR